QELQQIRIPTGWCAGGQELLLSRNEATTRMTLLEAVEGALVRLQEAADNLPTLGSQIRIGPRAPLPADAEDMEQLGEGSPAPQEILAINVDNAEEEVANASRSFPSSALLDSVIADCLTGGSASNVP
ncbi:unnamed protein product, partial [Amoebophrya sp. A25]